MERPNGGLPQYFRRFQESEEQMVLSSTNDSNREEIMMYYNKAKITDEDMLREYSAAEVRELCERTRLRVNMYEYNCVWDAKRELDKEKRLEGRSRRTVNKMLVKAVYCGMFRPYRDVDVANHREVQRCQTKKDNNVRLTSWHRPFNQAEIWELCVRTRARVNMDALNCVWDAKVLFDRFKRFDNRSDLWINKMLAKAVHRGLAPPYTDAQIALYREAVRSQTRRENDVRLNRWYRQRGRSFQKTRSESLESLNTSDTSQCQGTQCSATEIEIVEINSSE